MDNYGRCNEFQFTVHTAFLKRIKNCSDNMLLRFNFQCLLSLGCGEMPNPQSWFTLVQSFIFFLRSRCWKTKNTDFLVSSVSSPKRPGGQSTVATVDARYAHLLKPSSVEILISDCLRRRNIETGCLISPKFGIFTYEVFKKHACLRYHHILCTM